MLARQFPGTTPFDWEDAPADRRERVVTLLVWEGKFNHDTAGLGPDDTFLDYE